MGDIKKYGLSFALCGIAVILLSVFVFLGLDYWREGDLLMPILWTVLNLFVILICIKNMCENKSKRNKREGLPRECFSGAIIALFLLADSFPFTKFISIWGQQDKLIATTEQTIDYISKIDSCYIAYANQRIAAFSAHLDSIKEGTAQYRRELADIQVRKGGIKQQRTNLIRNLKTRLFPKELSTVFENRKEWIAQIQGIGIWNTAAPKNIKIVSDAGKSWVQELADVSSVIYLGEHAAPFSYPQLSQNLDVFQKDFVKFPKPSFICILLTLGCYILILTPYLSTVRPMNRKDGTAR